MTQVRFQAVSLQFGEKPLLQDVSMTIAKGDRVAILGRNGAGKSTLLKILKGQIEPDSGSVERQPGLVVSMMHQTPPEALQQTVYQYIEAKYTGDEPWEISKVISLVKLSEDMRLGEMSGGQLRRVSLAASLVNSPDILLLDEPTNHLDLESIEWLEKFLLKQSITIVLITHDRTFMQVIANRIFEIDLAKIYCWDGTYHDFLKDRETRMAAEATAQALFDKKLAQEEAWIRQGIKARRTRNEGRVRALKKMREEYANRITRQDSVQSQSTAVEYSGKLVLEMQNVAVDFVGKNIIKDFSAVAQRGDKIGILGPNGCGKSTLIKLILGELEPSLGLVKRGSQLKVAHFDQHRQQLNYDLTALDIIADGASHVTINGENKHAISYLQEFLFTPDKARSPVRAFSGGECNRLLLAKVLAQSPNLLILDEPTNDLDMETLEFLEDYLMSYQGTLLLVSHDRSFMDNVVTSTWVFEGNGRIEKYVGGYTDMLRQRKNVNIDKSKTLNPSTKKEKPKPKKLSYKDQRELDALPAKIEKLEANIEELQQILCSPDFYSKNAPEEQAKVQSQLQALEAELAIAFERWETLES